LSKSATLISMLLLIHSMCLLIHIPNTWLEYQSGCMNTKKYYQQSNWIFFKYCLGYRLLIIEFEWTNFFNCVRNSDTVEFLGQYTVIIVAQSNCLPAWQIQFLSCHIQSQPKKRVEKLSANANLYAQWCLEHIFTSDKLLSIIGQSP
jgi:hypothetical protein